MKMVIIEPLGVEGRELLAMTKGPLGGRVGTVYYSAKTTDAAELVEKGKDAKTVAVSSLPSNVQVIKRYRSLKLLAMALIGVGHIVIDMYRKNSVMICSCTGYSTCAAADLVLDMLTSLYRNMIPCDKVCRGRDTKDGLIRFEPGDKTFGVVGTRTTGLRVATIAQVFGCRVLAYSRITKDVSGVCHVDLEILLTENDMVSSHTPLTEKTRGLINKRRIGLIKKNAVFISTAKGPVVSSDVLVGALKGGRVTGTCIDVFENEPPVRKGHPPSSAPNIIVTPHAVFATKEALVKRAAVMFDSVVNYLDGTPRNVIG